MILVDANLIIYASTPSSPEYDQALSWFEEQLNGKAKVGLPWASLFAFLRIASNPKLFESASLEESWRTVEGLLAVPNVWIPEPTKEHQALLARFLHGQSPRLVNDAHLAALAIEHGLTLCSTDGDFARFEGLRWENPLKVG